MRYVALFAPFATFFSTVAAADYQILVGGPDAIFVPNNVTVEEGDIVTFTFINGSHSAIQSNFVFPCQPINQNEPTVNGFNSGIRPANNGTSITNLTVPITAEMVNVTIWFYDGAEHQCGWDETAIGGFNLREESNETLAGYQRNAARLFGEEAQNENMTTSTRTRTTSRPTATDTSSGSAKEIASYLTIPGVLALIALSATLF
ncbi:hypothetical protein CPB86DRAFT_772998 [Serendipita vermifera]|nr:hypothetical protein CPB86DRAFT_772998 [Serendipita vermifera]